MKVTNKMNIPKEIFDAIMTDHYTDPSDKPSDYSITRLIAPIQETTLRKRYDPENPHTEAEQKTLIVRDVLDNFKSWVGSVIHNAIEAAWKKENESIVEKRFYAEIENKTISGKIDLLKKAGKIIDWKTCSVYKIQKGDVRAWEEQQNLYAMLCRLNGIEVDKLEIVAIILDWKKREAGYKSDYPQTPIVTIKLNVWPQEKCLLFAKERIRKLIAAEKMTNKELAEKIPCTRYDQWSDTKDWAIIKKGGSRATKVFETEIQAINYMEEQSKMNLETHDIVHRMTEKTKCISYCDCRDVCEQYRQEQIEETGIDPHQKTAF